MREVDDEKAVAAYTGKSAKTFQNMRWKGEGPAYVKLGASVRYRKVDVDRWIEENTVRPSGTAA
ncbi:MAG: helix-turn-helix domain-containing protein [Acidimicrobiales bacterium]